MKLRTFVLFVNSAGDITGQAFLSAHLHLQLPLESLRKPMGVIETRQGCKDVLLFLVISATWLRWHEKEE